MTLKKIVASLALLPVAVATVAGCGSSTTEDPKNACKNAALEIYDEALETETFGELMALSAKYGWEDDVKLREALPECKNLTIEETNKIEKELENSDKGKELEAHITKLMFDSP